MSSRCFDFFCLYESSIYFHKKRLVAMKYVSLIAFASFVSPFCLKYSPTTPRQSTIFSLSPSRLIDDPNSKEQTNDDSELVLSNLQSIHVPIASSFLPRTFNPHPLLKNHHLQTISGVFLRYDDDNFNTIGSSCYLPKDSIKDAFNVIGKSIIQSFPKTFTFMKNNSLSETANDFWDERERIDTPDGDFFHVDQKYSKNEKEEERFTVIIVHGLESNSNSSLSVDLARAFLTIANASEVACINFRGCSGVPSKRAFGYHAGFTDDLRQYLEIRKSRDSSPIFISGFSLGSNVVLKCLDELQSSAFTEYNIHGAAIVACPFNLEPHYRRLIDPPLNRILYTSNLLKSMKKKVQYLLDTFCDGNTQTATFDYNKCINANTIAEVEDGLISPIFGVGDKFDYYRKTASINVAHRVVVPTLILNSKDDPFFEPTYFPLELDCVRGAGECISEETNEENGGIVVDKKRSKAPLRLVRTEYGGHLGYMSHVQDKGYNEEGENLDLQSNVSWASAELARFAQHVRSSTTS